MERGSDRICSYDKTMGWHPHQLRHTFGTAVEEELGDPRLTAELLWHSGLGSVAGYTKISRRRREEAAAALADRGF